MQNHSTVVFDMTVLIVLDGLMYRLVNGPELTKCVTQRENKIFAKIPNNPTSVLIYEVGQTHRMLLLLCPLQQSLSS